MSKSSRRREAAQQQAELATEDAAQSAADRVGAMAHSAADRVGPLAQSAADRVGPLAEAAADRLGAVADKVSPLAHTAAEKLSPWAHTAADRVGPLTHSAADRIVPLASQAADRVSPYAQQAAVLVTPYAHQAAGFVTPYAAQAAGLVTPYAQQAAERLGPLASTARERGGQVAQSAAERFGPRLDEALGRVGPVVGGARDKVTDDLLPRLSESLSAAGAAVVAEAAKLGAIAAADEPVLPEPKKKGRWLKRIAIVAAVAAVVALVARKFLGSKDADWQAARPSTPYTPATPPQATPTPAEPTPAPADTTVSTPVVEPDAPAGGASVAYTAPVEDVVTETSPTEEAPVDEPLDLEPLADGEAAAASDVPPETPTAEIPEGAVRTADLPPSSIQSDDSARSSDLDPLVEPESLDSEATTGGSVALDDTVESAPAGSDTDPSRYEGEGVYVGDEPPEGYVIKGNERSKKYHLPESGGYSRTIAEVWFNSEEAAQAAGFVRAQR